MSFPTMSAPKTSAPKMEARGADLLGRLEAGLCRRALRRLAGRWCGPPVQVRLPDGQGVILGPDPEVAGHPAAELAVKHARAIRRALLSGDLGFADGYLAGEWDTPDLAGLLCALAAGFEGLGRLALGHPLHRLAQRRLKWRDANTLRGSQRNISAHYDLGNAFYRAWLDRSMTYSAALFEHPSDTLEAAQGRKYAALARAIGLERDHHVLEIGCGWGGFAEYAAREIGARVTAITISPAQYAAAWARIAGAGLAQRVEVRLCDYREIGGRYDRIVSIEMFEAVGEAYWSRFFDTVRERLAPDGRAGLQVITIDEALFADYRRRVDFIQTHVFPGGMLPSEAQFRSAASRAGLSCETARRFGGDYARTLRLWAERFEAAWPALARQGFDERFRRLWRFYLAYCEAGFASGRTDVQHLTLAHA